MPPLMQIVVSNAVMATALALLVAVIAGVARRPALTHVLWLLVLLKLITPGIIRLPVSWPTAEVSSSEPHTTSLSPLAASSTTETDALPNSDQAQEVTVLIYPAADSSNLEAAPERTDSLPTGFWQSLSERMSPLWLWFAPLWIAGSL